MLAQELLEYLAKSDRNNIDDADFAGPHRSFPCDTQAHVDAAVRLVGHADNPNEVKRNIIRIAKRKGFTLPDAWQDDEKGNNTEESAATVASSLVRPRQKIATLRVCFLEYNARSLNGRIYPKATCDRIFTSAQRKLADTNSLPVTCFVSHEAANGNANTELVGRVTRVWQEASKFWADIDLADTRTARDMLALAEGGYMRSESMRVLGVELVHDRNYDLPLVVPQEGAEPELLGIDLTTRPGLMDTARIQQVLYEAEQPTHYTETFSLDSVQISAKEALLMPIPVYLSVIAEAANLTPDREAHQRIHDHLAGVLDATVAAKHGEESARLISLVEAELSEEGKAIAQKHAVKIAAAHDESAKQLGMQCEGAYNSDLGIALDPDQDGIPDAMDTADGDNGGTESARATNTDKGETQDMTPQEMMEALAKQGYNITAPKTAEEKLAELEAKLAEQESRLKTLAESASQAQPQRKTQALSSLNEGADGTLTPEAIYQDGDYLAGTLAAKNWKALSDRRIPWPKDIDPKLALREMAPFLAFRMNEQEAYARGRDISQFIAPHEMV